MRSRDAPSQVAHVAQVLLAAQRVNHRTRTKEEQRLEECVREHMEDACRKRTDAERQEHISQLRNGGVGKYALDVILYQPNGRGKDGGERANDGHGFHRRRRQHEHSVRTGHHVHARRHHGRGVDQRGNWSRAFHRIRQPDIERNLRRLAAGSDKQKQGSDRKHGIADRELTTARQRVYVGEAKRPQIPDKGERAKNESGIADAVHDERLVGSGRSGVTMKVKTDQQIRAQAHAFPSYKQKHVVIRQDERKHRKHEQVHVPKEAVVTAFVRHVSGGVNVDQHTHAGDKEQPDRRERIKQESGVDVEGSECPVALNEIQMPVATAQPGIHNFLEGTPRAMRKVCVLKDRKAGKKKRKHNHANANRVNRGLLQSPPEKKHHHGPEGREERDQPDVVKKDHVVSRRSLVARYSHFLASSQKLVARSACSQLEATISGRAAPTRTTLCLTTWDFTTFIFHQGETAMF